MVVQPGLQGGGGFSSGVLTARTVDLHRVTRWHVLRHRIERVVERWLQRQMHVVESLVVLLYIHGELCELQSGRSELLIGLPGASSFETELAEFDFDHETHRSCEECLYYLWLAIVVHATLAEPFTCARKIAENTRRGNRRGEISWGDDPAIFGSAVVHCRTIFTDFGERDERKPFPREFLANS